MNDYLANMICDLTAYRQSIDVAIEGLTEASRLAHGAPILQAVSHPIVKLPKKKQKRNLTPEGRIRIQEAAARRWARVAAGGTET